MEEMKVAGLDWGWMLETVMSYLGNFFEFKTSAGIDGYKERLRRLEDHWVRGVTFVYFGICSSDGEYPRCSHREPCVDVQEMVQVTQRFGDIHPRDGLESLDTQGKNGTAHDETLVSMIFTSTMNEKTTRIDVQKGIYINHKEPSRFPSTL